MLISSLHRWLFATWAGLLIVCLTFSIWRIAPGDTFESNILGLMPTDTEGHQVWLPAPRSSEQLQKNFVLLVSLPEPFQAETAARQLQSKLEASSWLTAPANQEKLMAELTAFFIPFRHQLLTPERRQALLNMSATSIAEMVLQELYSPVRTMRPYSLQQDPFNLAGSWMQNLFPGSTHITPGDIPSLQGGDGTWYLIRGSTLASPFDLLTQQSITTILARFQQQYPEARLLRSGLVFHSAEATTIARSEISTVGVGSVTAILLLVILIFRSRSALLAIIYTLSCSLLVAMTVSLVFFENLHLITLAFGSTLIGLAADYFFHFMVKYRRHSNSQTAGRLIFRGLFLSAGSSILAYAFQLYSPFPGLQQLAVFVISGLIGACLAVASLSLWYQEKPQGLKLTCNQLYSHRFEPLYRQISKPSYSFLLFVPLISALLFLLLQKGFTDDIRVLNTSSQSLLESERMVQKLLGGIDTQRYWIVEGENSQELLQNTEALTTLLSSSRKVMSVTQLTPSLEQQRKDYELIKRKLYGSGGALDELCQLLDTDCSLWDDLPAPFTEGLTPSLIPPAIASNFPALLLSDESHSLIFPYLNDALSTLQEHIELWENDAHYVDQVSRLSDTLRSFRIEVSRLFVLFLLIFAIICIALFRARALLILSSVSISLLAGLALSAADGITLFHILALLLVMGISVDTVIFYIELGLNNDTWLASTMANLTSILAFGLLSLSQVPVLQQFGSVVFFGLLCTWSITPLLYLFLERWLPIKKDFTYA